jgi:uncharacterized protein YjiK
MAFRNYKNFCRVTVSTGYDAAAVSIVLSSGQGALCPDAPFNAVWYNSTDYPDPTDDPNVEVIKVSARSTDTLTIIRAQEGSTASTKNTSAKTYKLVVGVTVQTLAHDITCNGNDPRRAPALSTFAQQLETTSYAGYGTLDGALSGFCYNALRDTVIFTDQSSTAGLGQLKELDANGTLIRTIDLTNFQDVECLTWMYGTTYALGEENLSASPFSRVTLCNISDVATSFDRTAGTSYDMAPLGDLNNLSIEGITYDPDRNLLYLIMEKSTTQQTNQQTTGVWMVWSLDPTNGLIRPVCDILQSVGVANVAWDLSDCYFDRNSQRLYISSHEGTTGATGPGKVVAVDIGTGKVVDSMTIDSTLTQAEAITFTPDMKFMFIAGETGVAFSRYMTTSPAFSNTVTFTWVVSSPTTGGVLGPKLPCNHIVQKIESYVAAATSATFNIEQRSTPGSAGTNIMSSDQVAVTTGTATPTTWNDMNLDAGNWLYLDISATSGTPGQLVVTLTCSKMGF